MKSGLNSPDAEERCFNASFVVSFSVGYAGRSFRKGTRDPTGAFKEARRSAVHVNKQPTVLGHTGMFA